MPAEAETPDLVASTGTNDVNSPWYSGLLQSALQSGVTIGTNALSGALQSQTPVTATTGAPATGAPAAAAVQPTSSKTGMYFLIGLTIAGVLAVIYIVVGGRK